jgi:hypothetical protein
VQLTEAPQAVETAPMMPESQPQPNVAVRASTEITSNPPARVAATPSPVADANVGSAQPAVAAFDAPLRDASTSQAAPARNETTLAAETQLLDRAFAALAVGDRSTASALVAEHARLFPNGLLRQERERARKRLATDPKGE